MSHHPKEFEQWASTSGPEHVYRVFSGFTKSDSDVADWLMSWGIGLKVCAKDVFCLYYDECPGMSGSGKMDWSLFNHPEWFQYLRLGFIWFKSEGEAKLIPGLTKSILSSQFRVNSVFGGNWTDLFRDVTETQVVTKTDGSSVQMVYIGQDHKWIECTNRNSVVSSDFLEALDRACKPGSFSTLKQYLADVEFKGVTSVINLEVCTRKRLVTPHLPDSFYINFVWDEVSGKWPVERIESLRARLEVSGWRCPKRLVKTVKAPKSAQEFENTFSEELIQEAVKLELEANPSVSHDEMALTFEGFVMKAGSVDLKWKHPTFRFLNKWMFNQSSEFQATFVQSLTEIPKRNQFLLGTFPELNELSVGAGRELFSAVDQSLKAPPGKPDGAAQKAIRETSRVIREALIKLNSLQVLDPELASKTRKEIFQQGLRSRLETGCLAEKFKVALDDWIRHRKRVKLVHSFAKRFRMEPLMVILCMPVDLYHSEKPEPFAKSSMTQEQRRYVRQCAEKFDAPQAIIVDVDGTLLKSYPLDTHLIGGYSSGEARMLCPKTQLAGKLSALTLPLDTSIFIATGAKISEECLLKVLRRMNLPKVGGIMVGLEGVTPWYQKRELVSDLQSLGVKIVAVIDDHSETCRLLSEKVKNVLRYTEEDQGLFKPQILQMFGPPGTGKSQFSQRMREYLAHTDIDAIYINRDQARLAGKAEGLDEVLVTTLMAQFVKLTKTVYPTKTLLINDFMNLDFSNNYDDSVAVFLLPKEVLTGLEINSVITGYDWVQSSAKTVTNRLTPDVIKRWSDILSDGIRMRDASNSSVESTFRSDCLPELQRLLDVGLSTVRAIAKGQVKINRAILADMRMTPNEYSLAFDSITRSLQSSWRNVVPDGGLDSTSIQLKLFEALGGKYPEM